MVRAFLFPEDDSAVRIIWLPFDIDKDGQMLVYETLTDFIAFPEVNGTPRNSSFEHHRLLDRVVRGREHRHRLVLWYHDFLVRDGSLPNRSIVAVTRGKVDEVMRGPVVFIAEAELEASEPEEVEDVTMHDFQDVVDYLLWYNGRKHEDKTQPKIWPLPFVFTQRP